MSLAVTVILDGMQYASFLFIISLGLTLTFGVMHILNLANGSVYAWGAYAGALGIAYLTARGHGPVAALLGGLLFSAVVGVGLGLVIELLLLRRLYGRDEAVIVIATFGLFLVLENLLLLVFGVETYLAYEPMAAFGTLHAFGVLRDVYGLLIIAVAVIVGIATWSILKFSRIGRVLTAVMSDAEISAAMGIRIKWVFALTFAAGCLLSAAAGALIAPTVSVAPGFSLEVIVLSLAIIVIGGLGSIPGAMVGALVVGILRAVSIHFYPELEFFAVFAAMVLTLLVRPEGLLPPPKARRI